MQVSEATEVNKTSPWPSTGSSLSGHTERCMHTDELIAEKGNSAKNMGIFL